MKLRAHAKINLSLAVLGTRPDGYHRAADRLPVAGAPRHAAVRAGHAGAHGRCCATPGVPLDERNLVWKAARLVWQAAGRGGEPAGRVHITKRIPAQGGLGGGSADGAAALVGLEPAVGRRGCRPRALRDLAVRLGADVPFFLCAGTALGVNRGDDVRPLDDAPARWVVLVMPSFGVSTPQAFRWWDEDTAAPRRGGTGGDERRG